MNQQMEQNIIQSTTVKTIKELKKQSEFRTSVEADDPEQNESTESGKNTPDDQTSKTQYTKFRLTKKASINILLPKMSQSAFPESQNIQLQKQQSEEITSKSIGFKRNMHRYTTQKQQQVTVPQPTQQIDEQLAMNLILNKSKTLSEYFTANQLTPSQIHSYITDNKQFVFSFMAFLNKLMQKGLLSLQLSNIQKPVLTSIEQYTINSLNREITKKQIDKQYKEQLKKVDNQFNKYQKFLSDIESTLQFF